MGAMDIAILGPVIHAIEKAFHITTREITWIINIYVLTNLISTPLLASLSDLYGRRLIYIYSVLLFAIGSVIVIFSLDYYLVVLGRGIQGFGSGGFFTIGSSIIGDTFPKEKQGAALGLLGAVYGLAFIIGPVIGGFLLLINWRWVFVLNLPMSLTLIIGSLKFIPSKKVQNKIVFDWTGMMMLSACLAFFAFSINRINTNNFLNSLISLRVLPYLIASIIILPPLIHHLKKSSTPIIDLGLFRSKQLSIVYFLAFGAGLGEAGMIFIPGFVKEAFALSYSNASFALIPMLAAILVGSLFAGWMLNKIGPKYILIIGSLMLTIGLIGIWKAGEIKSSFYLAEAFLGFGLSTVLGAPLRYVVNEGTREQNRASGQGLLTIFNNIGIIMSTSLVGALIASIGGGITGYKGAFLSLALISASLIFVSIGIRTSTKSNKIA